MRIVHIIKVKGIAGAENHLLTLLPGLRAAGTDARLIYLYEPDLPVETFQQAAEARGVPVERVVIRRSADAGLNQRLGMALARHAPEIVHTHLLHADLYGLPAARLLRVSGRRPRTVSTKHNDDAFRLRPNQRAINRMLWRMTDRGIAISTAVRDFSVEVEGARPDRIDVVPYGFEPPAGDTEARRRQARAELGLRPDEIVVGATCRLVEQKGLIYGLEAFAAAAADVHQARLVIIGDGPLRNELETRASELGLGSRARFPGWRDDAVRLASAFDIYLMPSLWEGFGLTLLEAMGNAVPVVGSRVSAIPEVVVDGETGLLAPPRDVETLEAHLRRLLGDAPLRRHMGLMGRERLEDHYSAGQMVTRTLAVYEQAQRR